MAFLKVWRTIRQYGPRRAAVKTWAAIPMYLGGIKGWRMRRCQCCKRITVFISHRNSSPEFRACLFCSANERYELLATEIRSRYGEKLLELDVLEFDPHSPLRTLLSQARSLTRSFYEEGCTVRQKNGAVFEDITSLTFGDGCFDLMVSSDMLEHVPDLGRALSETARVLRPGGVHLFTVPPRETTKKRAEIVEGEIKHIAPPEYHLDPLCPEGILAFWDIGPDLSNALPTQNLEMEIVRGPVAGSGRVVWAAERPRDGEPLPGLNPYS